MAIPLPRARALDVKLARRCGWRSISWASVTSGAIIVSGLAPDEDLSRLVPRYSSDPNLFFDLAHAHAILVTRPLDLWIVAFKEHTATDPFFDNFPREDMVEDPGERIIELVLERLGPKPSSNVVSMTQEMLLPRCYPDHFQK